jgi:hypothetical protein
VLRKESPGALGEVPRQRSMSTASTGTKRHNLREARGRSRRSERKWRPVQSYFLNRAPSPMAVRAPHDNQEVEKCGLVSGHPR